MTGVRALNTARAAGVEVGLDGADLVLKAPSKPRSDVLDVLSRHKAKIVAQLQPGPDGWSAEDWQLSFDERAGIVEFDGGLPRRDAETSAFAGCVAEWVNRNPVRSPPGCCHSCGRAGLAREPLLRFGGSGHAGCWPAWRKAREADATAALAAMGVSRPRTQG